LQVSGCEPIASTGLLDDLQALSIQHVVFYLEMKIFQQSTYNMCCVCFLIT